jgi:hypothetical protein
LPEDVHVHPLPGLRLHDVGLVLELGVAQRELARLDPVPRPAVAEPQGRRVAEVGLGRVLGHRHHPHVVAVPEVVHDHREHAEREEDQEEAGARREERDVPLARVLGERRTAGVQVAGVGDADVE